jgi:hypothetical protein
MITVVCQICKEILYEKEGGTGTSHGMCQECGDAYLAEQLGKLRRLGHMEKQLKNLREPGAVVHFHGDDDLSGLGDFLKPT